jgi:MHS family citrate/tricarballylate:H+ symporter-like MFS transporter
MTASAIDAVPRVRTSHLAAAVIGNALEFYDFTVFTFFATQIGATFFPSKSSFFELMGALITFGVGFVGRPIGGVVLGAYGDRYGRKPAMLWSFGLMGFGVLALALTPSYAAIGIAAPVIVVLARLVQGFALGGEVGPTTAFLIEAATPETRGFYTTLQFVSQGANTLLGGLVGYGLTFFFDPPAMQTTGWRVAFLLGALILPIGCILRNNLPETHVQPEHREFVPWREWAKHGRLVALGILSLASATICTYVLYFLPTYAARYLHANARAAFASGIVFGGCNLVCSSISGILSDRIGRKPLMLIPRVLLLFAAWPCFAAFIARPDPQTLLIITAVIAILGTLSAGANLVAITELLPKGIRSGSLATIYAVSISVFGGTTQPIIAALTDASGNLLAPAWYLMAATLVGVTAMALMPESAPVKTGQR